MKTNKSLLVKFLTVLCALCLSLSVAFGLVACGEDVKSIIKTEIKNGELIVTYSDNTTANLGSVIGKDGVNGDKGDKGEDGKDANACDHKRLQVMSDASTLGGKYEDACAVKISLCLDCQHVLIEKVAHELETVAKIEPTCTTAGVENGKQCKYCSFVTDGTPIPALGHNYDYNEDGIEDAKDYHYVVNENSNICEDGAVSVKTCVVCGHTEVASMQAPQAHIVNVWAKTAKLPTLTEKGNLLGVCETCDKPVVKEIPALNDADYVVDTTNAPVKCSDEGKILYTLKEEIVDADGNAFVFELPVAAKAHTVKGVAHADTAVYNLIDLDATKVIVTSTVARTCKDEGYAAVYFCDKCDEPIDILVKDEHTVAENAQGVVTAPNCIEEEDGYTTYPCSVCGEGVKKDYVEWAHTFEYDYEKVGDIYKVVETCSVDGCDYEAKYDANVIDDSNKPTCEKEGSIYFAYVVDEEVVFEKTLTLTKLPHKILVNGVAQDFNAERVYELKELGGKDAAQLIITDGKLENITCSAEDVQVVVKCANNCGGHVDAFVTGDHVYDEEKIIEHKATCTTNSYVEIWCTAHNGYVAQPENNDKLGHDLVYGEPVLNEVTGKYEIAVTCKHADADPEKNCCPGGFDTLIEAYSTEILPGDEPTCLAEGKLTVWLDAAKTQFKKITLEKTAHSIYIDGQLAKVEDVVYTISRVEDARNGLIITEGTVPTCESTLGYGIVAKCQHEGCPQYIDIKVKGDHTGTITDVAEGSYAATCLTNGVQVKHCSECNGNFNEVLYATGHTYAFEVTAEPTISTDGVLKVTCACGLNVNVTLPKFAALAETNGEVAYVLEGNQKLVYTIKVAEEVLTELSCANDGVANYKYTLTFAGNKAETVNVFEKTYTYTEVTQGHEPIVPTYTWTHEGKVYTAYLCEHCHKMFVTVVEDAE